jgi:hypothetical protein
MAGALPRYRQGPASYTAGGYIVGGQLVVPATGLTGALATLNGVGILANTTAGASNVLGVAATDANTTNWPEGTPSLPTGPSQATDDNTLLDMPPFDYQVAVYNNVDINVTYSVAATLGVLLVADNAGGVKPRTAETFDQVVGKCTQPGGVAAATAGRAFIRV